MSAATTASRPLATALPYVALFGGILTLCAGTSFAKQLFPQVGAEGTSAYRVGFSALILLLVWRPWRVRLGRADLRAIVVYGVVLGAMNLCFYMSLRTIPLGVAIAIEFTGPLAVALISSRKLVHVVWIALAAFGLVLLLPIGGGAARLDPTGMAFACTAAVCWALYILAGRRVTHMHPGRTVALGMTVAAMVVAPIGVAASGPQLFNPSLMILGLVVALLSSAIPYSLEMIAMKGMSARSFGVMLSAEPVVGALAGAAILGEHLAGSQWLAVCLIIAASVGTVLTDPKRAQLDSGTELTGA